MSKIVPAADSGPRLSVHDIEKRLQLRSFNTAVQNVLMEYADKEVEMWKEFRRVHASPGRHGYNTVFPPELHEGVWKVKCLVCKKNVSIVNPTNIAHHLRGDSHRKQLSAWYMFRTVPKDAPLDPHALLSFHLSRAGLSWSAIRPFLDRTHAAHRALCAVAGAPSVSAQSSTVYAIMERSAKTIARLARGRVPAGSTFTLTVDETPLKKGEEAVGMWLAACNLPFEESFPVAIDTSTENSSADVFTNFVSKVVNGGPDIGGPLGDDDAHLFGVMADGATYIDKAVREFDGSPVRFRCLAHVMHRASLAIVRALGLTKTLEALSRTARTRSTVLEDMFGELGADVSPRNFSFTSTRWGQAFQAIDTLNAAKTLDGEPLLEHITKVVPDVRSTVDDRTSARLRIAELLLSPIFRAIKILQGDDVPATTALSIMSAVANALFPNKPPQDAFNALKVVAGEPFVARRRLEEAVDKEKLADEADVATGYGSILRAVAVQYGHVVDDDRPQDYSDDTLDDIMGALHAAAATFRGTLPTILALECRRVFEPEAGPEFRERPRASYGGCAVLPAPGEFVFFKKIFKDLDRAHEEETSSKDFYATYAFEHAAIKNHVMTLFTTRASSASVERCFSQFKASLLRARNYASLNPEYLRYDAWISTFPESRFEELSGHADGGSRKRQALPSGLARDGGATRRRRGE